MYKWADCGGKGDDQGVNKVHCAVLSCDLDITGRLLLPDVTYLRFQLAARFTPDYKFSR